MHYYLGQYEWVEEAGMSFWRCPHADKVVGVIDLRPLSAQSLAGGVPEGFCFLSAATEINDAQLIFIGSD